jgi:excisionase family DNA binding protein
MFPSGTLGANPSKGGRRQHDSFQGDRAGGSGNVSAQQQTEGREMKPGYLKPKEAAEYLSISRPTLYALKGQGVIKFYKLGGSILVKVSELDAAVEKGVQE